MAPPRRSGSRPGRVLAVLGVLILVMLAGILGGQIGNPGKWRQQLTHVGLGLDLSSGTQVVLQAYAPGGKQPTSTDMAQAISILEARVNGMGTSGASVTQQGSNQINVSVPGAAEQQVVNEVSNTARLAFRPVLLWQPNQSAAKPGATPSPSPKGTASPNTAPSGTAKPSAAPTQTAKTKALIVHDGATPAPSAPAPGPTQNANVPAAPASPQSEVPAGTAHKSATMPGAAATPSPGAAAPTSVTGPFGAPAKVDPAVKKLFNKMVCKPGPNANTTNESWKATVGYTNQKSQWDNPNSQIVSCDPSGNKFVLDKTVFDGTDVTSVQPQLQQNSTAWVVGINLNQKATKAFGDLTTRQASQYLPGSTSNEDDMVLDQTAVVLGGNVVEAPQTQGALTSGSFQISGGGQSGFSEQQANSLANVVKYGQLPLNFQRLSANYVSPTLGHNSLVAGLIAGAIGLIVVLLYLFAYYRGLGLFVAVPSLIISALLAYLGVVLLSAHAGFTMSLAAIAGLIVAIGITADSFIVYFERLRDEVREGKQLRPAVESGWNRARRTILVSDTVQFLAAVLLYKFATSDVQGFAFTLGLTTLIDVVVVFLFTKPMMTILASRKFFREGHPWSGLDPKRLGARTPWRSGVRRTQRSRAERLARTHQATSSSTTTREA